MIKSDYLVTCQCKKVIPSAIKNKIIVFKFILQSTFCYISLTIIAHQIKQY